MWQSTRRLKMFMYMMDSMTDDELDGKVDIEKSPSRVVRIARGSGTHPMEVRTGRGREGGEGHGEQQREWG